MIPLVVALTDRWRPMWGGVSAVMPLRPDCSSKGHMKD